jgi:hypothetical protein
MARASRCPSSMGGRGILPGRPRALASRSRQPGVRAHAHAGTDTAAEAAGRPRAGRSLTQEQDLARDLYRAERRSQASGAGAVRF